MKNSFWQKEGVRSVLASLLSIVIGLLAGSVIIVIVGCATPSLGFKSAWEGVRLVMLGLFSKGRDAVGNLVFGFNPSSVGNMLFRATPLIMTGLSVAVAFKTGLFNIGAPGQYLAGTAATLFIALSIPVSVLPGWLIWMLAFAGGMLAGALWGFIPAWFKARFSTNETLFTLMMNYVAIQIVACCVNIWRGQASSLGKLNMKSKAGWFPQIMGQRYTINLIVVVALTIIMYCYLRYSKQGYEISVVGESENTARYAGINVGKVIIRTMILSGALCGLTGFLIVGGRDQAISTGTAGGNGFTAIIVAWLAKFNTFTMALISFLLIFLEKGAAEIASAYNLNDFASDIIAGVILFFILGSEFFINYKAIFRGHAGKEVC